MIRKRRLGTILFALVLVPVLGFVARAQDPAATAAQAAKSGAAEVERVLNASGIDQAKARFEELRTKGTGEFAIVEKEFNVLGYRLLQAQKPLESKAVFEMNVAAFPGSWNAWDSLGQGLIANGEEELAEKAYLKSLELNPQNTNAKGFLSFIQGNRLNAQRETKVEARFKPGEKTGLQGPYLGQKPPGLQPEVFAPGIVSTAGHFDFSITFTPDGHELYFTSRPEPGGQNAVWVSRWEKDGWTAPEIASFSKVGWSNEPFITPDGKRVYFGSRRPQPGATEPGYGIWVSDRTAGGWSAPRLHGPGMYVSTDRSGDLYLTDITQVAGGGIIRYPWTQGAFGKPERLGGGVNQPTGADHAFIAPDGSFIVFDASRPGGQGGEGDLYVCFRQADGSWGEAFNLGDSVNTETTNFCPSLSPDGKYLFFGMNRDIYWVSAEVIHRLRPGTETKSASAFDPRATLPAADLKEDLETLWSILEEGHAGLERFASRDDLKRMFDEAGERITSPLSELEFYKRALPLIAAIKDGHTRLDPTPRAEDFLQSGAAYFPFVLRFIAGKAFIFHNLSSNRAIREGSEILAIDGVETAEILSRLSSLVPSDAGILTRKLRLLEDPWVFGRLLAVEFDRPASYSLRFALSPGAAPQETSVPGIRAAEIASGLKGLSGQPANGVPLYGLSFKGKTAVLSVRALADDRVEGRPAFPDFLKQAFTDMARNGATSLVIDLRDCGGGQDDYAKLLFAHVADGPFVYYESMQAKRDRFGFFKFTNESAADAEAFARSVRKNERGLYDVAGHPNFGPQSPERPVFRGRVAILIGGASASATGEAILLFHYHRKAVFFGEESGAAYGGSSGYIVTAVLPHSGLRVRLPLVLTTLAAAGYPRDGGFLPEVPVSPVLEDLLAGRDPVMDRALKFLENDEVAADLSPTQARALLEGRGEGGRVVVLDVRTPAEFAEGHLPEAMNIDFRAADFAGRLAGLDKAASYLVYCRGGRRSFAAMGLMKSLGFLRVYNLEGGMLRWQAENPGPSKAGR